MIKRSILKRMFYGSEKEPKGLPKSNNSVKNQDTLRKENINMNKKEIDFQDIVHIDDYCNDLAVNRVLYDSKITSLLLYYSGFVYDDEEDLFGTHYKIKRHYVKRIGNHFRVYGEDNHSLSFDLPVLKTEEELSTDDICFLLNTTFNHVGIKSNIFIDYNMFDVNIVSSLQHDFKTIYLFLPHDYVDRESYKELKNKLYKLKSELSSIEILDSEIKVLSDLIDLINISKSNKDLGFIKKGILSISKKNIDNFISDYTSQLEQVFVNLQKTSDEIYNMFFDIVNNNILLNVSVFSNHYNIFTSDFLNKEKFIDYVPIYLTSTNFIIDIMNRVKNLLFDSSNFNSHKNSLDILRGYVINTVQTYVSILDVIISNLYLFFKYFFYDIDYKKCTNIFDLYYPTIIMYKKNKEHSKTINIKDTVDIYYKNIIIKSHYLNNISNIQYEKVKNIMDDYKFIHNIYFYLNSMRTQINKVNVYFLQQIEQVLKNKYEISDINDFVLIKKMFKNKYNLRFFTSFNS